MTGHQAGTARMAEIGFGCEDICVARNEWVGASEGACRRRAETLSTNPGLAHDWLDATATRARVSPRVDLTLSKSRLELSALVTTVP